MGGVEGEEGDGWNEWRGENAAHDGWRFVFKLAAGLMLVEVASLSGVGGSSTAIWMSIIVDGATDG